MRNTGKLIAGSAMLAEGAALVIWRRRYLDFMARQGLLDGTKRLMRRLDLRSTALFVAIGVGEAIAGAALLRRARA